MFLTLPLILCAPSSPLFIFLYHLSHTVPLSFHASSSFCFFISLFFVSFVFAMNSLPPQPLSTVSQVNTFFLFRHDITFQLPQFHPVFFSAFYKLPVLFCPFQIISCHPATFPNDLLSSCLLFKLSPFALHPFQMISCRPATFPNNLLSSWVIFQIISCRPASIPNDLLSPCFPSK